MADMLVPQRQALLIKELETAGVLKVTELAARLGVSRDTVRRDLLGLEAAGRVTRVRGGALLAGSRTVRNPADGARSVVPSPTGSGQTVGLLVPSTDYYYPEVVAGVRAVAARRGARLVIGLTDYARPRDLERLDELGVAGATGLLVVTAEAAHLPAAALERLRRGGLPFVLVERRPQDVFAACEYVISHHQQGASTAVRHFAELGHERVGLFTNGSPTAPLVREGYATAVRRLGLAPGAPVVDSGHPTLGGGRATVLYDRFIADCRASGTLAALVHSDHDAIGMMRRMRALGLRPPDDLALIAYDDEISALADVPLTAIAPPKRELGELAAQLLLERLEAADPSGLPIRQLTLQPRLVIRSSCGAPGRG
ncbi:LacI family DNA-binding transcriptional regulator [Streptomyces millisiae]|uniref:LacI family DNA-binding transcriptional regulator n=1 Tax=Streptomyces millisiae TaxID=3075542 RepID=A0ABU2LGY9_9ACTN|nr:LacI family DNA-binding transcriptional regulator [Streptomyces sp. DSM 44918]MDT0316852.1 LacI family DNA-binding transcriptional regulator [Streptomyces sp. DSM 44918]